MAEIANNISKSAAAWTRAALIVLGVLILAAMLLWLVPIFLVQQSEFTFTTASEEQKALADARTGLVAFLAVLGTLGGLYYTAMTYRFANDKGQETAALTAGTLRLNERGQITDRYAKAIEMLGSSIPEVCIGGTYALGQIMRDNSAHEKDIVDVLSAFVRRKAKRTSDLSLPWRDDEAERDETKPSFPIQAALDVLAEKRSLAAPVDLRDSDLRGARLRNAQLQGATLYRCYLYKAKLSDANFTNAHFRYADLTGADLRGAVLLGADLREADLRDAKITVGGLLPEQLDQAKNSDQVKWVPPGDQHGQVPREVSA
jgi:Pentapeptide repeats (8 copies)